VASDNRFFTRLIRSLAACVTILSILLSLLLSSATAKNDDKLFASHENLGVSISGPFKTLYRERDPEKVYAGQMNYTDAQGALIELEIELQARGNYRRAKKNCKHPPLRIIVDKEKSKSSLFAKLKDVKIVVPCGKSAGFERLVILEYLIYRMYNELTPQSYRVRLMVLNLVNNEREQTRTFPAFFIEPHRRLAKRLDWKKIDTKSVNVSTLEVEELAKLSLFQFMIGNTDCSPLRSPVDENCCHNVKLFQGSDSSQMVAVPYDFDFSGFVGAPYAVPSPKVGIRSVKMRRYRGFCRQNNSVIKAVTHFNEIRDSIEALINASDDLSDRVKAGKIKYLAQFFEIINDPKTLEKKVLRYCR